MMIEKVYHPLALPNTERAALAGSDGRAVVNVPNAITLSGYALHLWWLSGGPTWAAFAGLLADELDGIAARRLDEASAYGGLLDWAVDLTLTGLTLNRLGILPVVPLVTAAQVYLRDQDYKPSVPFCTFRAASTLAVIAKERMAVKY